MRIGPFEFSFSSHQAKPKQRKSARRAQVREFGGKMLGIEYLSDLLIQLEALQGASVNRYLTKRDQVQETVRKYKGQAAKGNLLVRNVLETRAAFTVGKGMSVTGWEDGSAERSFVNDFFRRNRVSLAFLRELGRERCFEGQVLLALVPGVDGVPGVRYVSWLDTGYEVIANPMDYADIRQIHWDGKQSGHDINPGQAAFMKFHTRLNDYEGTPLFAGCLNVCEDLDDALALLKKINNKAANPTPYWQFEDENDAKDFREFLASEKWEMGDALAGSGTGTMLQLGYGPYSAIEAQITTMVKMLSGHTSVPPHYFGFSELLNNRAVADDIRDMYVTISETELDAWGQGFTDLVGRAMAMYNAQRGDKLDHQAGAVQVEQISEREFREVLQVWMPSWLGGGLSTETFLSKLPGINQVTEAAKLKAELKERQELTPGQLLPEDRVAASQHYRAFSTRVM